jgi:hypothetical protein
MVDEKAVAALEIATTQAATEAAAATGQAVIAENAKKDAEASTTKVAAEATVALTNAAAAAAALDASERERSFYNRVDIWQTQQGTKLAYLETEAKETKGALAALATTLSSVMERLSSIPLARSETVKTETTVEVDPAKAKAEEEAAQKAQKTRPRRRMV